MRTVSWVDENGYKRARMLRDVDPDECREEGIPLEPPDVDRLDWDAIKRDLHNALMDRGLTNWGAIQAAQNGMASVCSFVLRRRLLTLIRGGQ